MLAFLETYDVMRHLLNLTDLLGCFLLFSRLPEKQLRPRAFLLLLVLLHGRGLSSIRYSAAKYGGECRAKAADEQFVLEIFLPLPQK